MTSSLPNLFAMPPGVPFLEVLAARLVADPVLDGILGEAKLEEITILLPNRRAVGALGRALLEKSGKSALLLPALLPLGDEAEDLFFTSESEEKFGGLPPTASEMERHLVLAAMVRAGRLEGDFGGKGWPAALHLGGALAQSFNEAARNGADFAELAGLAADGLAAHREENFALLRLITEHWPNYLKERGLMDPLTRRNALLEERARAIAASDAPVLIAGSTGSNKEVANLMGVVAGKKNGAVILPAFEFGFASEDWSLLTPSNPHAGVQTALSHAGFAPADVRVLPALTAKDNHFCTALFLPPERAVVQKKPSLPKNLHLLVATTPDEEAAMIALLLRDHLASGSKGDAVLVSADRALAEQVSAWLSRFGLEMDDAAGQPLARQPVFVFFRLLAEAALANFSPAAFLALAKHPFAAAGLARPTFRRLARLLEINLLRDEMPPSGLTAMLKRLRNRCSKTLPERDALIDFLERIEKAVAPFASLMQQEQAGFSELVQAHIAAAENLAGDDRVSGPERLWIAKSGETQFFTELLKHGTLIGEPMAAAEYPPVLTFLAQPYSVRPHGRGQNQGARIHHWGMLEARLLAPELLIIGGLNEGSNPSPAAKDPWLNRAMRQHIGLPPVEAIIGHQAHDFLQCQAAGKIFLSRTAYSASGETLPASRWLMRAAALGLDGMDEEGKSLQKRVQQFDPLGKPVPALPPEIIPPVALRPKMLSASALGQLAKNPYEFYARRILRLKALPELDAPPSAALLGLYLHELLEEYGKDWPYQNGEAVIAKIMALGEAMLAENAPDAKTRILWRTRLERVARNMARLEQELGTGAGINLIVECNGKKVLQLDGDEIVLQARADRIDVLPDGRVRLFDYKTGAVPINKEILSGRTPQLPLIALLALAGGYEPIGQARGIDMLAHLDLKAKPSEKVLRLVPGEGTEIARATEEGLRQTLRDYLAPDYSFPFLERRGGWAGDYDHLARLAEWRQMEAMHGRR